MAPRSSWKGFLKLSLVSVPVRAYTASSTGNEIRLNQLHKETHQRIKYQKVAPGVGEVSNDEIVKGYEYAKGQYVVIDDDELDKLRTESDKSINIDGFVSSEELDAVYYGGRTYYLTPDGAVGQKPYQLLLKGMEENGVYAVAEVVISGREQVVLVRPVDGLLSMTVLNRHDQVKSTTAFKDEVTETETNEAEMNLTNTLIQASIIKDFDFARYKDNYKEKLTKLIQMKVEGQEVVQVRDPEEPKIINLMEALKASVAEAQAGGSASPAAEKTRGSRKQAPSTRSRSKTTASKSTGAKKKKVG
jgi:DNA end-binding protein Ku